MIEPTPSSRSLLSPLRDRNFAVLWSGLALAFLAQWMLPVAAQWHLLSQPGGEHLVPLVTVALTLPMALLAIPAGVLADSLDRRRLIIAVQSVVAVCEACLCLLAIFGGLTPLTLLTLLAVVACGMVMSSTSANSMIPDIVDHDSIPSAAALLTIAVNASRIVGPAVAGLVIAVAGVGWAFAAALPPTLLLLLSLVFWQYHSLKPVARERLIPAAWSGIWFVRHSPQALKALLRGFLFTAGLMALFSLLPLLAADAGADSAQLGLLMAGQGVGAVLGAVSIPLLRARAGPNAVVALGCIVAGIAVTMGASFTRLAVLGLAVILAGWAWTTVLATLHTVIQMYLPAWVRARGVSMFLGATYIGQSCGSLVLGWTANEYGLRWALTGGAVILAVGAWLAVAWPLKNLEHLDRSLVSGWHSPELSIDPRHEGGQVQVLVTYSIPKMSELDFLRIMHSMRRIRLRTGALRWQLLRDAEVPDRFIEEFALGSWADYEHQMRDRSVASDRAIETQAARLSVHSPEIRYVLRVHTIKAD